MLLRFRDNLFILSFLVLYTGTSAQSLFTSKKTYTKQDTLAGSITPERSWWNVVMYQLQFEPDLQKFSLSGNNRIQFEIVSQPIARMQIDLQEPMHIDQVLFNEESVAFVRNGNLYYLQFSEKQLQQLTESFNNQNKPIQEIEIFFQGIPKSAVNPPWDGGLVWKKDNNNNPWVGVSCQGEGASIWWPCKDHPTDEPDSTLISVITPDTLMNVSNGRLRNSQKIQAGKMQWTWAVTYPINIYNITLNIGKYSHFKDTLQGEKGILDLDYYVLEYNLEKAKEQFKQVKPKLRIFEYWMGPYPFYKDGYKLVETSYLGMEHQSAVSYGNQYRNGYLGNAFSGSKWEMDWDYIIVHESGHEWFGNHLSYRDVADMWLHEGFTTYTEALYISSVYGSEASQEYIQVKHTTIQNDAPIIGDYYVKKEGSSDMYSKGAALIHMIRMLLQNDSMFRSILRKMQIVYGMKQTTSAEIESFLSRESGLTLKGMFDQYLRTIQIPTLEYRIKKEKGKFILYYKWSNCINHLEMPILLPQDTDRYLMHVATTRWKKISTDFSSAEEVEKNLNRNFYVVYKKSL